MVCPVNGLVEGATSRNSLIKLLPLQMVFIHIFFWIEAVVRLAERRKRIVTLKTACIPVFISLLAIRDITVFTLMTLAQLSSIELCVLQTTVLKDRREQTVGDC